MEIHTWMTRLFRNQWLNVPSGLIMLGYFLEAMRLRSSSETLGPYTLGPVSWRLSALPCEGGRYVSGWGMTCCFVLAAAARRRSNSAESWRALETWRTAVAAGKRDCGRRVGRSGGRGSRKRGIECSEAMAGGRAARHRGVLRCGCGGPRGKIEVVRRKCGRAPARGNRKVRASCQSSSCPGSDEPLKCFPRVGWRRFPCGSALAFSFDQPWLVTCGLSNIPSPSPSHFSHMSKFFKFDV